MTEYTLSLTDEQVAYFENLDCQKLVQDMQMVVDAIDSLDFEDTDLEDTYFE